MLHDTELTKELAAIRMRFIGRIEEWLPSMECVLADLDVGMFSKTDLKGLRNRLHKIAGSAGSFGFSRLSVVASELERHLDLMRMTGYPVKSVAGMLPYFNVFLDESRNLIATSRDMPFGAINAVDEERTSPRESDAPPEAALMAATAAPREPLILIVDDDDLMRAYLTTGLAQNGWSFIEAVDGQRALDLLNELACDPRGRCPDLIVMDVEMPEMDGFIAMTKIKDSPALKDIPIMMLTARDEDISYIRGYAKGAVEYLTKPIELPVLEKVVQNLLRQPLVS